MQILQSFVRKSFTTRSGSLLRHIDRHVWSQLYWQKGICLCAVDYVPPTDFWTEASMWVGLTIMWPAAFRMTRCPGRLYRNNILPSRVTTSCAAHCWLHSLFHSCIHRATLGSGLYISYWLPERAFSPKYAGQKKRKEKKRKEKKRKEKKRKEKKRKEKKRKEKKRKEKKRKEKKRKEKKRKEKKRKEKKRKGKIPLFRDQ